MLESFQKNQKGIYLICISSILACIGQLLWKLSSDGNIGHCVCSANPAAWLGADIILLVIYFRLYKKKIKPALLKERESAQQATQS